ncbi:hypothetical protein Chor_012132 [Crotalus horridus]
MKQICTYHDVVEYLNISSKKELLLYSIPKKNWEETLEVGLDFTLISILSVVWKDEFISWNPLDFCNITSITLPVNLFWTPHIFIDEQADEDKYTVSRYIDVSFDGSISLFQAYQLTSACNLDIHPFPFDEQKCNLTMVPALHEDCPELAVLWVMGLIFFPENEVKIKSIKTSQKTNQDSRRHYLAGGEWKFENIAMKRRSILHELIVILPIFVLFLLDMAISCAFSSPAEKIAFKVTMILQVSFLSTMLIDKLPPTSDYPPVIAIFFTGIFAFMVLGILENACMEYFKEQNSKFPSFKTKNFIRKFLRKEKIKAEDSITDVGEEIAMENKPTREFPLVENDITDSLVFLKQLSLELQQIKKHLALEESKEVSGPAIQDKYVHLGKCLCYIRLVLSLGFIAFIVVQWRS